jgi:hypothetical protein
MTITETREETATPPPKRRLRMFLARPTALAIVAVAALLLGAASFAAVLATGQQAQDQAATVAQDTAPAVLTLDVLCQRNDQLGADLRAAGACGEKVDKAKQAGQGQTSPPVPAAAGLSRDDVATIVQAQLAGRTVTVDQVMNMVIEVYRKNPPKDGQPGPAPTADQVLQAVQIVCGGGKCQGPKGDAAPPASPAEIYAQVQAFCGSEGSPCRGPQGERGEQGVQGVSIVAQTFARNDQGECRNYITLSSDTGRRIDSGPASDAACPVPEPPASTPPTP